MMETGENVEVFKKRAEHKKLKYMKEKPEESNFLTTKSRAGLEFIEVASDADV